MRKPVRTDATVALNHVAGVASCDTTARQAALPSLRFGLIDTGAPLTSHAILTRHGGISTAPFDSLNVSYSVGDDHHAIAENRRRCAQLLDLAPEDLVAAGLVHGAAVGRVENATGERLPDGSLLLENVDALISATPGRGLLVTAADCLQVMLVDPRLPAVGLVHAGWRGLVADVIGAAVQAMADAYGSKPDAMLAGIGPGLSACCAEFTDPHAELPASFQPFISGRNVDLRAAARDSLRRAGLHDRHIAEHDLCTQCRRDEFFSHRGDAGRTGRFAAIIAVSGPKRSRAH